MKIDFIDETDTLAEKHERLILDVLQYAGQQEAFSPQTELSVAIVTNETIRQLNQTYRQKDSATDVLSFPVEEDFPMVEDEAYPVVLGDIIISKEKAEAQAEEYGHPIERELAFLAVHGFLHLIGYTHDDAKEEKEMFGKQEEILEAFRLERS